MERLRSIQVGSAWLFFEAVDDADDPYNFAAVSGKGLLIGGNPSPDCVANAKQYAEAEFGSRIPLIQISTPAMTGTLIDVVA